jgi:hypothetical protein
MQDRPKVSFANLVYLLQSRRQQARVFGPAALLLLFGTIFAIGSLTGDIALHESPFNLVALALAVLAAFAAWEFTRNQRAQAPQRVRSVWIAVGAVVIGALMLLGGGSVGLLWSVLLAALGLNLVLAPQA